MAITTRRNKESMVYRPHPKQQLELLFAHGQNAFHRLQARVQPYKQRSDDIWRALSMRAKLTVLIGSLVVTMTGFFYGFAVFQTNREIKLSAVSRGQAIAEALKDEVAYALQANAFPSLNFTFRRIASSRHSIAYIFLLNSNGDVLSHNDPDMVGKRMLDPMTRQTLASTGSKVQFETRDLEGLGEVIELCDVSTPVLVRGHRAATLRVGISLTQSLQANTPRIRSRVTLFALPFACLAILIAMKLSDSFTRPLRRLAQAASEVSKGNYDVQLPLNRQDELGDVAQAFNTMAQALKENFAKVSDMANRDGLTTLYNARFFQEALTRELERTKRTHQPLSLLIFDVDWFKKINDRYGHPIGDQVLQHLSHIARSVLRGYDVLARYGGEEFIAMLTETTSPQAMLLGERLRKLVEQRPYQTEDGESIKITVSIGVASARAPYDKKEFISRADQALYRAKGTGRNRVMVLEKTPAESSLNIV
jgi:diguanylate cyclase (GGDEF)-like protein